jgi:hypothetical protein
MVFLSFPFCMGNARGNTPGQYPVFTIILQNGRFVNREMAESASGFGKKTVKKAERLPQGGFPSPNPEKRQGMARPRWINR